MNRTPKISVIIPLYNAEQYIARTMDSVLGQTYKNFEVVIVNDCPTDRTIEIVSSYNDERIRIIHNTKNEGIAYSRNRALEFCQGEYIALMDHDDIILPYRFEKQVAYLDEHKDISIVGGATQWIDIEDNPLTEPTIVTQNPRELRARILFYNIYWNCEVMFRRSVIDSGLRYRNGCCGMEDFCFWIEASKKFKMSNIPELVLQHRECPTSETNRVKHEMNEEKIRVFEELRMNSLTQSGYCLNDSQITILNRILKEDRTGYCETIQEENAFIECLNEIVRQAEVMNVDYFEELRVMCNEFIMEKTSKGNNMKRQDMTEGKKLRVDLIGSCIIDSILRTPQCMEVFEVNKLYFQANPWNFLEEPLGIDSKILGQYLTSNFDINTLDFVVNKTGIPNKVVENTDVVILDLFGCANGVLCEVGYNGRIMYVPKVYWRSLNSLMECEEVLNKGFYLKTVSYKEIPMKDVYSSLDGFAEWLQKIYKGKIIVIVKTKLAKKYLNNQLCILDYSVDMVEDIVEREVYYNNIVEYLAKKINQCILYEMPSDLTSANWGNEMRFLQNSHFMTSDYLKMGTELLETMGIDWKGYYKKDLMPLPYMLELWCRKSYELKEEWKLLNNEMTKENILKDDSAGWPIMTALTYDIVKSWKTGKWCKQEH